MLYKSSELKMAWYTDFRDALRNYPWKSMSVIGIAATTAVVSYYAGKWEQRREPAIDRVVLTRDLDGDGKGPDAGVILLNGRSEAVCMQDDRRTFLSYQGMLKKYKGIDGLLNSPRKTATAGTPAPTNPLDEPFNVRAYFTPSTPVPPTPTTPKVPAPPTPTTPSPTSATPGPSLGRPTNDVPDNPDRTAYASPASLERRAEIEFQPAGTYVVPMVPVRRE